MTTAVTGVRASLSSIAAVPLWSMDAAEVPSTRGEVLAAEAVSVTEQWSQYSIAGPQSSIARFVEDLIRKGGPTDCPDLLRRMVETSAETVEWLVDAVGASLRAAGDAPADFFFSA